jgi:SAM-dependent methyltransferase
MNQAHIEILSSPRWAEMLERDLLPWVSSVADLGDDVLEIGPGPGLTTDLLRTRTTRLTAVEIDPALAKRLAERLAGTNVEVVNANAADTGFPDGRFSGAACFAVLHHVPSVEVQDQIFSEILRMLRPGAALVASDGYDNEGTRLHHSDDLFVPIDPEALPARLAALGFTDVAVDRGEYDFRFIARKPA